MSRLPGGCLVLELLLGAPDEPVEGVLSGTGRTELAVKRTPTTNCLVPQSDLETSQVSEQQETFLRRILRRRDEERGRFAAGRVIIHEEDAFVDDDQEGTIRWYMHPDIEGACINSMIAYRHEIPPQCHSGKQKHQGYVGGYFQSGFGRMVVNGISHDWEAGDALGLPPLQEGLEVQFFNDSDVLAKIMCAEPNFIDIYGVDRGSGFEQLEEAGPNS